MAYPYQLPDLILTRLASLQWPVRHVSDFNAILEDSQIAPALLVIPYGLRIIDEGPEISMRETVLVVAVTRAANQRGGQDVRQQAGTLLSAAALQLVNWQPTTGHLPLGIETPPQPQFVEGAGLYPLQFYSHYALT